MRVHRLASVLATAALVAGAAGCGGDDEESGATTPPPAATTEAAPPGGTTTEEPTATTDGGATASQGKQIFTERCSSCHTLADAGATGNVGPNLDQLDLSRSEIERQVRQGGGAMPSFEGDLSDAEIKAVAEYVEQARGG